MRRRTLLLWLSALASGTVRALDYPVVVPGRALRFPEDHGAHPVYRTEWWYVTGWMTDAASRELGVQVTFFRNRPRVQEDNPSAFAPRQLLFAHAALADPRYGRLRCEQRSARQGFGLAAAATGNTDVRIDDWSLRLDADRYLARVVSREFELELRFDANEPLLLQGRSGFSRKGPRPGEASYYYSRPQLEVDGFIDVLGGRSPVSGRAWLDHEWSSTYLPEEAAGWDWTAINLDDGGALMAFRMRDAKGGVRWAAGKLRDASGRESTYAPGEVEFTVLRRWRSPRTGIEYPVAMRLRTAADELELAPLMDDQEFDSRPSTGTIYWEGAVRALRAGQVVGRGYLELTGYGRALQL